MAYSLVVTNRFDKDMKHLMPKEREISLNKISEILENPHSYKQLSGALQGLHSARFGAFRIIFAVDESKKQVILFTVRPRERVYE